jgi:hypothetical protein
LPITIIEEIFVDTRIYRWLSFAVITFLLVISPGCSKKKFVAPERPEIQLPKSAPPSQAVPIVDEAKSDSNTLPPLTHIHPVQWHADFQGDVNQAAQHLLSDVTLPAAYDGDKRVFPTIIGFFQDMVPGVGTQATVINIISMAFLEDFFALREYKKTLEVPNGCEVLKQSGIAPALVEQALTGCLGDRFTIAQFPFDDAVFGGGNVFGAAGALPEKEGTQRPLQASYLQLQSSEGAFTLSTDSMFGDTSQGLAFSGVLVFESVDPRLIPKLNDIVDSHLQDLGLPMDSLACRNAIKAHPNFMTGYLHYIQFLEAPPVKAYPPFSPAACTDQDWINIGRNMLVNGCATPWENCQGPENFNEKYNAHVGKCTRETTIGDTTIKGINFEYIDEAKSKSEAFVVVGMMVKEDQTWYVGELDEWAIPECGLQPLSGTGPVGDES